MLHHQFMYILNSQHHTSSHTSSHSSSHSSSNSLRHTSSHSSSNSPRQSSSTCRTSTSHNIFNQVSVHLLTYHLHPHQHKCPKTKGHMGHTAATVPQQCHRMSMTTLEALEACGMALDTLSTAISRQYSVAINYHVSFLSLVGRHCLGATQLV